MAAKLCDICGVRAASVRVTVLRNGAREELDVCDYDYSQLTRHQKYLSPLESLFGGDAFDDLKAHADVYNVLLQVLDDGRLTDGKGRVIDFKNTLIIATSNLAFDVIMGRSGASPGEGRRDEVMAVLRRHFRPEFLNRIDEIIIFDALSKPQIRSIVELQLGRIRQIALGQGVTLSFENSLLDHLAEEGFQPELGARTAARNTPHSGGAARQGDAVGQGAGGRQRRLLIRPRRRRQVRCDPAATARKGSQAGDRRRRTPLVPRESRRRRGAPRGKRAPKAMRRAHVEGIAIERSRRLSFRRRCAG
jgi:hypothetical protein